MYVMPKREGSAFNRPNSYIPYILYTGNKQLLTSFETEFYYQNSTYWNNEVRFHNYPDFYFGVGSSSQVEDEEIFTNRFFRNRGSFMKMRGQKLFYGLAYDFRYDYLGDFKSGGLLSESSQPGIDGGWSNGLGPAGTFDSRNDVLYPSAGSMIAVSSLVFNRVLGSGYNFGSVTIDARHFLTVFSDTNILALQGYFNAVFGDNIPFYRLPQLGGEDRLRGIANENLYRDKTSWYVQAEGRQHLFWRFGGTLFAGVGNVAPSLGQLNAGKLKGVAGIGGRFQALKEQRLNIRVDAGFATDGHYAIYISLGEAF